jgi:RNA polymerase sigma-70 factor (ECF subfamily)
MLHKDSTSARGWTNWRTRRFLLPVLLRRQDACPHLIEKRLEPACGPQEMCYAVSLDIHSVSAPKLDPLESRQLPSQVVKDDEPVLVAAAKAGDINAFETLVGRYERKIFRLAQNITQNREDAEDTMQEAFLKAFEHLKEFQGNSRFYTWLVRIAVNQALMKLRKRRPNQVSLDEEVDTGEDSIPREVEDWGPSPEERYKQSELHEILASVIGDLDPSFRIVFQLRDIEELSTEETAEALGLSVPAVKSRLLRARLKLRQKLNRYFRRSETS